MCNGRCRLPVLTIGVNIAMGMLFSKVAENKSRRCAAATMQQCHIMKVVTAILIVVYIYRTVGTKVS